MGFPQWLRGLFGAEAAASPPEQRLVTKQYDERGMGQGINANDVYDTVAKHDYGAVPFAATAEQGIAFLNAARFSGGDVNLVDVDPLRAMDLALGVGERVLRTGQDQFNQYLDELEWHPVIAALNAYSPGAYNYYTDVLGAMAMSGQQDPDRAAWQAERRAYLAARPGMTHDQAEIAANDLASCKALQNIAQRNPYSVIDAKLAIAQTLPSGAAFDRFYATHILPTVALATLRTDAPTTADDLLSSVPSRRAVAVENARQVQVAAARVVVPAGAPVSPTGT